MTQRGSSRIASAYNRAGGKFRSTVSTVIPYSPSLMSIMKNLFASRREPRHVGWRYGSDTPRPRGKFGLTSRDCHRFIIPPFPGCQPCREFHSFQSLAPTSESITNDVTRQSCRYGGRRLRRVVLTHGWPERSVHAATQISELFARSIADSVEVCTISSKPEG